MFFFHRYPCNNYNIPYTFYTHVCFFSLSTSQNYPLQTHTRFFLTQLSRKGQSQDRRNVPDSAEVNHHVVALTPLGRHGPGTRGRRLTTLLLLTRLPMAVPTTSHLWRSCNRARLTHSRFGLQIHHRHPLPRNRSTRFRSVRFDFLGYLLGFLP